MQLCALLSFLTAGTNFVVTLGKGFPKTANEAICILTLPFLRGGGEILWMNVYCGCCLFFLSPSLSVSQICLVSRKLVSIFIIGKTLKVFFIEVLNYDFIPLAITTIVVVIAFWRALWRCKEQDGFMLCYRELELICHVMKWWDFCCYCHLALIYSNRLEKVTMFRWVGKPNVSYHNVCLLNRKLYYLYLLMWY